MLLSHVAVQVLPHFTCAEEKNRLLRAVAGSGLDSLSSLRAKWDKLELVVESHQLMIKEQVGRKTTKTTCRYININIPVKGLDASHAILFYIFLHCRNYAAKKNTFNNPKCAFSDPWLF